jgi:hypothetical protein|tara:strand:+ start:371 stop:832 length:462 start_codon:yes stop_codon:yes gene_type:complete
MRFIDCTCGSMDFDLDIRRGMVCKHCGRDFNPFSGEHIKIMKDDNFHYFWLIITPHFQERFEDRVSHLEIEELVEATKEIEKVTKKKKYCFTIWNDYKVHWIYKYNYKKKRLEMEFITIYPASKREKVRLKNGYVIKNSEFVKVDFDGNRSSK